MKKFLSYENALGLKQTILMRGGASFTHLGFKSNETGFTLLNCEFDHIKE